ncbi:MAG: ABC transporter ATP-binding protein [Planctomycetota bacterium]
MAADPPGAQPALQIDDLTYRYPGASEIATRVAALRVAPGERVLLAGQSGSGKSTLLHLLAGLIEPTSGSVSINGQDIHALRGAKRDRFRGRHLGMVFQTFNLLHGFSAIENVMAALMFSDRPRSGHRARAGDLLKELGIERPQAMPDQLSVGQQQRVAVARALACEPSVVLADEPTASLDPDNAKAAVDMLQSVCTRHGAALVCVSHDPSLNERFERVERLEALGGRALAGGAA